MTPLETKPPKALPHTPTTAIRFFRINISEAELVELRTAFRSLRS